MLRGSSSPMPSRLSRLRALVKSKGSPEDKAPPRPWRRRLRLGFVGAVVLLGEYVAATQVNPRLVPRTVDVVRAVFGPEFVAQLEDRVYGAKDRYDGWKNKDSAPKTYWEPEVAPVAPLQLSNASLDGGAPDGDAAAVMRAFPPAPFPPPIAAAATKVDGNWYPMADDVDPASPVFVKTLVHPDAKRPYAAVAIVAMDLERVDLHMVAGTEEPSSETVKRNQRPGRVPDADHARLIAAFNGGWQTIHGHFGMMVDGLALLPPKDKCCTVALFKDGTLKIAPWTALSASAGDIQSYRQTPPCLREGGSHHALLQDSSKNWGAAVDGATVIRRSAIGIDKDRKVLFYGVGDSLTALTIAEALGYAGAYDVAELDVNAAFPRFLTYGHGKKDPTVKESLIPAIWKPGEYVTMSWYRDFFYVTRKP